MICSFAFTWPILESLQDFLGNFRIKPLIDTTILSDFSIKTFLIKGCRILQWAYKNRAFLKFKVHFWCKILIWSFWKRFSLKNLKLEEHLLLVSFLFSLRFEKLYLVNFGLNFVGSVQNLGDCWEQNKYTGLISDQNWNSGWMRDFLL